MLPRRGIICTLGKLIQALAGQMQVLHKAAPRANLQAPKRPKSGALRKTDVQPSALSVDRPSTGVAAGL
jgi:hypothetical protein